MATKKTVETRRKIAGTILHISPKEGGNVPASDFNDLLMNAKKLAGSILSSKEPPKGLMGRIFG